MSADKPVGEETKYSKTPFEDNVTKSIPPDVKGASGHQEGDTHHAAGGAPYGKTFSDTMKQLEKDGSKTCGRSPW